MNRDWYKTFFQGVVVEMWDRCIDEGRTRHEADFILRHLGLGADASVLDAPCGTGRLAIPLAQRGCHVRGLDLSETCLEYAIRKGREAGVNVHWQRGDVLEPIPGGPFDGAFCFGNSFCYFDPEGMKTMVANIAGALRPGARFIIDAPLAAECILAHAPQRLWADIGDITFLMENNYVPQESRYEVASRYIRNGKSENRTFSHWVYSIREIHAWLASADLPVIAMYATLQDAPFALGSDRLYLVAEKR